MTPSGMVWWRFKLSAGDWHFGYASSVGRNELVRMGRWNGDTNGGRVVSVDEIEWKAYWDHKTGE